MKPQSVGGRRVSLASEATRVWFSEEHRSEAVARKRSVLCSRWQTCSPWPTLPEHFLEALEEDGQPLGRKIELLETEERRVLDLGDLAWLTDAIRAVQLLQEANSPLIHGANDGLELGLPCDESPHRLLDTKVELECLEVQLACIARSRDDSIGILRDPALEYTTQQCVVVGEVMVERPTGEARAVAHACDGQADRTFLGEHAQAEVSPIFPRHFRH